MAELRFKQIAVTNWKTGLPNAADVTMLYGLTEDGKVFSWDGQRQAWGPLSMKELGS